MENYKYHISNVWAQPYRKNRIDEFLNEKDLLGVEDMKNLQMDIKNLHAVEFLPHFLNKINNIDENIKNILENWNYLDDKDLSAPLIFDKWYKKVIEKILKSELNDDVYKFMPNKELVIDNILRKEFNRESSILIKNLGGIENLLSISLNDAINELNQQFTKNISKWKRGNVHKM